MKMCEEKINIGCTVRINQTTNSLEKENYLWTTELFKVSKVLDTKLITCPLCDMNDEQSFDGFYDYI